MMNTKDEHTMEFHGITRAEKDVFFYKDFRYDRLEDALRYAEIDAARASKIDAAFQKQFQKRS